MWFFSNTNIHFVCRFNLLTVQVGLIDTFPKHIMEKLPTKMQLTRCDHITFYAKLTSLLRGLYILLISKLQGELSK